MAVAWLWRLAVAWLWRLAVAWLWRRAAETMASRGLLTLGGTGVTWVMFDYGGVISHPPTQQDLAQLAGVAGAPVPALTHWYWKRRRAYDLAELDAPGYWRQVGRGLGRHYSDAEIFELNRLDRASWLRLHAGTIALIEDLRAAGLPLALLSNAPGELADAIGRLPMASNFGHLLFSCELKLAKPDPECYAHALARLGASAEEVIFIDDRSENVTAAAALGLQSLHFSSPGAVRAAVARHLADRG